MIVNIMTLQINTSGAWRNVLVFDEARRDAVIPAVIALAVALGPDCRWCVLDADGKREWLTAG